jgi:hypothetical protein
MKTTIDIPEPLYKRAKIRAVETGRTLRTLMLVALENELGRPPDGEQPPTSYWSHRKLLPEYEAFLKEGAYSGGADSTESVSEDRASRDDALL